jgi:N-acetylglucosaminyldiphosphoundecaprenol N-acetyl-beta-D-mannosaminyltransferase
MSEQVQLGSVWCDFMDQREFLALCRRWLAADAFHHVVTLNPEMVMLAAQQASFRAAVARAEVRVPDGAGLIWARWYLRSRYWLLWPSLFAFLFQPAERVTGVETVLALGRLCAELGMPLYLLGGTAQERRQTAMLLHTKFRDVRVVQAPAHDFDPAGPEHILADIRQRAPAVLLVAYGAPKQTLWIERQRSRLPSVRIAVGVGGAFAMLSERLPRAPAWLRSLNLEWLWRLYLEPRRLPRILQATVKFPLYLRRQKLKQ